MREIEISVSSRYSYYLERGLIDRVGELISEKIGKCKILVISDDVVDSLYGNRIAESLTKAGYNPLSYVFEHGEKSKNAITLNDMLEFLAENYFTRNDVLLALGGGVVGDLTGFAAAVFSRGMRYIQFPTTFLAAIDSSVGGKTAVNLKAGKNLAGVIYQPVMVVCDPDAFDTLEPSTFAEGTAEALKYGILADKRMFSRISKATFRNNIEDIIESCVGIKAAVVSEDEFDNGKRQLLNLGHTFAHSIEKNSGYSISHGEAVGIGLLMASKAAAARSICKSDVVEKIYEALVRNGLPTGCGISRDKIAEGLLNDKKRNGNSINMVFPEKIGKCEIINVSVDEIGNLVKDAMKTEAVRKKNGDGKNQGIESERIRIIENMISHRVLLAAALADRETIFKMDKTNEDIDTMIECLKELGADTEIRKGGLCKVTPISMNQSGEGNGFLPIINCKNNATAFRLLVPVIAAMKRAVFVSGTGELSKTPFDDIIESMEPLGSVFRYDHFPFELSGELKSGELVFDRNVSVQFLSGLLMALPLVEGDSRIIMESEPDDMEYVNNTLRVLVEFGIDVEKNDSVFVINGNQSYKSPSGFEIYDLV